MGMCISSEERQDKERSQRIDRLLEEDNRKLKRECKILLLGKEKKHKAIVVSSSISNPFLMNGS
jgi:guanine nucleotide-binding protein subunit alpha